MVRDGTVRCGLQACEQNFDVPSHKLRKQRYPFLGLFGDDRCVAVVVIGGVVATAVIVISGGGGGRGTD